MKLKDIINRCGSEAKFFKAVEDKLRLLAAEKPDFIYNPDASGFCSYNGPAKSDGIIYGPQCNGCIFGQAFQLLGWDDEVELQRNLEIGDLLNDICGIRAPRNWRTVQMDQDKGLTWAETVKVLE